MNQHSLTGEHPEASVEQACLVTGSLIRLIRFPLEPQGSKSWPVGLTSLYRHCR